MKKYPEANKIITFAHVLSLFLIFLCKISFTSVKTKQKKRIFVLKERKLYYGNT